MTDLLAAVRDLLLGRGATLATAESLTGGQLAALITSVPGASAIYLGGVVGYATRVKTSLLGVPEEVVAVDGVISAACAEAMAVGVRRLVGSTYALATTGVAGPDLQEGHPAGTVHLGLAGPGGVGSRRLSLSGTRSEIQAETCREALASVLAWVEREETRVR